MVMLPDSGVVVPRLPSRSPGPRPGNGQTLDHHLGDPALVHLGHPQFPAVDAVRLPLLGDVPEGVEQVAAEGDVLASGRSTPSRSARSSTLIRPSTSHRRPSTRTTSGSSSGRTRPAGRRRGHRAGP